MISSLDSGETFPTISNTSPLFQTHSPQRLRGHREKGRGMQENRKQTRTRLLVLPVRSSAFLGDIRVSVVNSER